MGEGLVRGEVRVPSPNSECHQEPSTKDADHVETILSKGKAVGAVLVEASLLEEVSSGVRMGC